MTEKRFLLINGIVHNEDGEMFQSEICAELNVLHEENKQLKKELFETRKELLWTTSDEVDRVLYYEDEVEELRKEIFE